MARTRTVQRAEYQRYIDAFLEHGPNFAKVAEVLNVAWKSAKQAWDLGWPEQASWAKPVSEIYADRVKLGEYAATVDLTSEIENVSAPANAEPPKLVRAEKVHVLGDMEIRRMLDAAIAKVRADVAEALLEEQQALQVARNNVSGILISVDKMLAYTRPLVEAMMSKIAVMATDTSISPETVLKLIGQIMKVNKGAIEQGAKLLEMQRLLVGAPQSITESRTTEKPAQQGATTDSDRAKLEELLQHAQRRLTAATDTEQVGEASADLDDSTDEQSNALT